MKNKVIAIALALTTLAWVAPINGATVEELQAQINALLQQIAQLQAQLAAQGGSTATGCFTKTLQKGMKDAEVTTLQQVLKSDPSIYPEGLVTGYFGSLTEAAVKRFQAKYGLDQVGIVGPATRAKLNSLYCGTAQQTTTVAPTYTPTTAAYGNLSVNKVPVANPSYTYYAGGTYELFAGEFKATGSDITVRKIGIDITTSANVLPWQKFSTISLWEGSTKLAELAINQANLIENVFASNYTLNVAGLNWVIPNGQKKTLTVKATLLPTLTTAARNASFTVSMNSSTVYTDTAGVVYTTLDVTGKNLYKEIGTVGEANSANLIVSLATDNPVKSNVIASTSNTTAVTLLKFTVKNDSDVSATLNRASTTISVANATTTKYVTGVELWDGSTRVQTAAPTWSTSTATNTDIYWENFTLPIAANTTKTLTVKAIIASIPTTDETFVPGSSVKASNVWLQGLDANSNIVGSTYTLAGNEQYVFVKAPVFALGTTSFTASGSADHPQSIGNAKITLGITAYNNDIYIDKRSANTFATTTSGTVTPISNFTCTTNATEEGDYYRISAGSTATCELNTVLQLSTSTQNGFYQVIVGKITWNTSASGSGAVPQTWGWDNFKTGSLYLSY